MTSKFIKYLWLFNLTTNSFCLGLYFESGKASMLQLITAIVIILLGLYFLGRGENENE